MKAWGRGGETHGREGKGVNEKAGEKEGSRLEETKNNMAI
jgi:hypothetical protein